MSLPLVDVMQFVFHANDTTDHRKSRVRTSLRAPAHGFSTNRSFVRTMESTLAYGLNARTRILARPEGFGGSRVHLRAIRYVSLRLVQFDETRCIDDGEHEVEVRGGGNVFFFARFYSEKGQGKRNFVSTTRRGSQCSPVFSRARDIRPISVQLDPSLVV